jgi:hypothetical protein
LPELCSGRTKAGIVDVEPDADESTLVAVEGGAFTITLAGGIFSVQNSGKTRSQILPWHRKVNWQLSALDSAIGKIAVTIARIKIENFIF